MSIPTDRKQTSRLFTRVSEDLNSGLPRTNSASGRGGTWTRGLWIAILVLYPPGLAASLNLNLRVRPQWRVGEKPWEQGCWTSSSSCFQVISYLDPHQSKHLKEFYSYSSDCSFALALIRLGWARLSPCHHFPPPWKVGLGEIKENNQTKTRTLAPVFHPLRSTPITLAAMRVRKTTSEKTFLTLNLRWLDWIFWGWYLPSLSINYVGMSKDMEKRLPQLYYIKMKISYDLGFIAIGVAMAT